MYYKNRTVETTFPSGTVVDYYPWTTSTYTKGVDFTCTGSGDNIYLDSWPGYRLWYKPDEYCGCSKYTRRSRNTTANSTTSTQWWQTPFNGGFPHFLSDTTHGSNYGYNQTGNGSTDLTPGICAPCKTRNPFLKMTVSQGGTTRFEYSLEVYSSGGNPRAFTVGWRSDGTGAAVFPAIAPFTTGSFAANFQECYLTLDENGKLYFGAIGQDASALRNAVYRLSLDYTTTAGMFNACHTAAQEETYTLNNTGTGPAWAPDTADFTLKVERSGGP